MAEPSETGSLGESVADEPNGSQRNISQAVHQLHHICYVPHLILGVQDLHAALIRERQLMLLSLESLIALRCQCVSSYTKLRFYSSPVSISDPPAELNRADPCSADFIAHRTWVSSQLRFLHDLALMDDKQEDRHLEYLIRKLTDEVTRLHNLEHKAWTKEMVVAGLLHVDGSAAPKPVVVHPCAHPEPHLSLTSY